MYKTFQAVQEDMHDIFSGEGGTVKSKVEVRLFVMHYLMNLEIIKADEIQQFLEFSYKNYELLAEQFKENYKGGKNEPIFSMSRRTDTVN